jgi:hypothetical protein
MQEIDHNNCVSPRRGHFGGPCKRQKFETQSVTNVLNNNDGGTATCMKNLKDQNSTSRGQLTNQI